MCAKKRKNKVIIQLSPDERTSLWIYLDLISFVNDSCYPNVDEGSLSFLRDTLNYIDGDPRTLGIEMSSRDHRICCIALTFANRYFEGQRDCFITQIDSDFEQDLLQHQEFLPSLNELFFGKSSL